MSRGLQGTSFGERERKKKKKKSSRAFLPRAECWRSQGATCSIAPPELESGLKIPGGIAMADTAFYLVKEPLTEGYRIRMSVVSGLVNVKGSIGRVPNKNQFQLVGVPNDDLGKEVTLTIATTIPCTECGMSDFNLYLMVEVRRVHVTFVLPFAHVSPQ
jgi:hypothetical protein